MKRYRITWETREYYETYVESEIDLKDLDQETLHALVDDRLNADKVEMKTASDPFIVELVGERLEPLARVKAVAEALARIMHNVTFEYPGYIHIRYPNMSGDYWSVGLEYDPSKWTGQLNKHDGTATKEEFTLHGVGHDELPESIAMRIMMAIGSAEMGVDR